MSFLKQILYDLKRRNNLKIKLQWIVSKTSDYETGVATIVYDSLIVKRVIRLPDILIRDGKREVSSLDVSSKRIVIDRRDLPKNFEIKIDFMVFFNNRRWEIQEVIDYEDKSGYEILVKELKGQPKNEQHKINYTTDFRIITNVSTP